MTSNLHLDVHDPGKGIVIMRVPNGGYVVTDMPDRLGCHSSVLGAFTTRLHMLQALAGGEFAVSEVNDAATCEH